MLMPRPLKQPVTTTAPPPLCDDCRLPALFKTVVTNPPRLKSLQTPTCAASVLSTPRATRRTRYPLPGYSSLVPTHDGPPGNLPRPFRRLLPPLPSANSTIAI